MLNKPVLDFKSLKEEFVHHRKIWHQMQKVKPRRSKFKGRTNHLPPINQITSQNSANDDSNNFVENLIASELQSNKENDEIEEN